MVNHDKSWFFHVQNEIRVRFECHHLSVTNIAKREIMPDGWKMLFFNLKMIEILKLMTIGVLFVRSFGFFSIRSFFQDRRLRSWDHTNDML